MIINKDQTKALAIAILNESLYPMDINLVLNKMKKSGVVSRISSSVKNGTFNINEYLKFDQYNKIIERFHTILEERLPHCNRSAFYKNIKKLTITDQERTTIEKLMTKLFGIGNRAYFEGEKNNITLYEDDEKYNSDEKISRGKAASTTHELLHMASYYKKGLITICGFEQTMMKSYQIGKGINEGYTEKLNMKYFATRWTPAYPILKMISEGIEDIVGEERMEQLYFDGDLKSLIDEIAQYSSTEQALLLIQKIDKCHAASATPTKKLELAGEIRVEISNIYLKKQRQLLDEHKITKEQYEDAVLKSAFYVRNHRVEAVEGGISIKEDNDIISCYIPDDYICILKNTVFNYKNEPIVFGMEDHKEQPGDIVHCTEELIKKIWQGTNPEEIESVIYNPAAKKYIFMSKQQSPEALDKRLDALNRMLNENQGETERNATKIKIA